jgi:hypothetical protein
VEPLIVPVPPVEVPDMPAPLPLVPLDAPELSPDATPAAVPPLAPLEAMAPLVLAPDPAFELEPASETIFQSSLRNGHPRRLEQTTAANRVRANLIQASSEHHVQRSRRSRAPDANIRAVGRRSVRHAVVTLRGK